MANPNWPSFPGVPNMSLDGDGRPQAQDLIPGKQLGTPLNAAFFNQLIDALCRLADDQDTVIGPKLAECFQAIAAETQRAEGAESQALSGTYGLTPGDIRGVALHTGADTNIIWYNDERNGWRALSLRSELLDEISRAQAAEADIRTTLQTELQAETDRAKNAEGQAISGTYGLTPGDIQGIAIHTGADTNIIWYNDARNGWRALALRDELLTETSRAQAAETDIRTALQAEQNRAQSAESQALSGTYGLTPGDIRGLGVHTQGNNNAVVYNDERNGWRALTLNADHLAEVSRAQAAEADIRTTFQAGLQAEKDRAEAAESQALSGTYGLTPGDIRGLGVHTQGNNNAVVYNDERNGWRALALQSDFASANTSPGWCKMGNGIIFQWCYIGTSNSTFNLPIAFPNAALAIFASNASPQGDYVDNAFASFESNSSFFCATKSSANYNTYQGFPIYILAIGC